VLFPPVLAPFPGIVFAAPGIALVETPLFCFTGEQLKLQRIAESENLVLGNKRYFPSYSLHSFQLVC
jgi:hypothetical protein